MADETNGVERSGEPLTRDDVTGPLRPRGTAEDDLAPVPPADVLDEVAIEAPEAVADPGRGEDLKRKAVRGAAVTFAAQITKIVVQFTSVAVLSRLLTPRDYGLVAMVLATVGIADVFRDFGLSSAAIQARTLDRRQQHNLFWLNSALGLLLAVVIAVAAPAVADVFHEPRLIALTRVLSSIFFINGVATQYRADLTRRMRFRQLAIADTASPVIALALGIGGALAGWGYWALAAQQIGQGVAMTLMVAAFAGWLPRPYHRDVPMRHFVQFGWKLAGSQLLTYVSNNVDEFMIGRWFGAAPLGLYSRVYTLVMQPLQQVRAPFNSVAVPVLSRMQDEDERYGRYVIKAQVAMGYTMVLALGVGAGAAAPTIAVFLGDRWTGAAPIFTLLCISAGFTTLAYVGYWVYLTRNLMDHLLRYTVISTLLRVVCVVVGARWGGVTGVAIGVAVSPAVSWPLSFWWLSRQATIPVRALIRGGLKILLVCLLVGLAARGGADLISLHHALLSLCVSLICSLVMFALCWLVLPFVRSDIRDMVDMLRAGRRR